MLTNEQINSLIAFNLPNNTQQLISPAKVREVLLAMQEYSDENIYTPTDTLQSVTDRGASTSKQVSVGGMRIAGGGGFFATVSAALTANRSFALPDNAGSSLLSDASTLDAAKVSGMLDISTIPIQLINVQVVSSGAIADLTTPQQAQIVQGAVVTTTDGRRWSYKGIGSKTSEASYIELADVTPEWSVIANKPSTFTPSAHVHDWADITTGKPTTLAGYGIADGVSTGSTYSNPSWLTGLAWSKISGTPTTVAGYGITNAVTAITLNTSGNIHDTPVNFTVSGGTATGTLSLANQAANTVLCAPNGSTGTPAFRALVAADIPNLPWSKITSGLPTTLAGYGITNGVPTSRTLTINGTAFDLSADRSWTVGGSSQWVTTGSDIYYTTGRVAIGATSAAAILDVYQNAIGASPSSTAGISLLNTTAATNSVLQVSPTLVIGGKGWNTTTSASVDALFRVLVGSVSQVTASQVLSTFNIQYSNAGSWQNAFVLTGNGNISGVNTLTCNSVSVTQTVSLARDGVSTSQDGFVTASNSTVSAGQLSKWSPRIRLSSTAWTGAAGQTADFIIENRAVSGTNPITASLFIASQVAGGGYTDRFQLSSAGDLTIGGKITTASPSGATATWKLGRYITVSSVSLITNRCVQVEIDGNTYYLGVVL